MPKRFYGNGIRNLENTSAAAFLGGCLLLYPHMIDSVREDGTISIGFAPALEATFGHGSFDYGKESTRFEFLVNSGTTLGTQFETLWAGLQQEVSIDGILPTEGILSANARAAGLLPSGEIVDKGQWAITKQREEVRHVALQE